VSKGRKLGMEFLDALPEDGERRLMLAVLIDAVWTLRPQPSPPHRMSAHRAWLRDRAWITSENDTDTFSFVSICNALGLNSGYVRRCVLHPEAHTIRVRRYAERVKESWRRLRRDYGTTPTARLNDAPHPRVTPHRNGASATAPLVAMRLRAQKPHPRRRSALAASL
jgi:hypothetical protein